MNKDKIAELIKGSGVELTDAQKNQVFTLIERIQSKKSKYSFSEDQLLTIIDIVKRIKTKKKDLKAQEQAFIETMKKFDSKDFGVSEMLKLIKKDLKKTQKVKVQNWPKTQKVKGEVTLTNLEDIKIPDIVVEDLEVDLLNKKTPKDYMSIRLTDGKKWLDPRKLGRQQIIVERSEEGGGGDVTEAQIKAVGLEMEFDYDNAAYYTELSFDVDENPDNKSVYVNSTKATKLFNIDFDFSVTDQITKVVTRITDGAIKTEVIDIGTTINKTVTIA